MDNHNCRVCGLYIDNLPWGEDNNTPTYEICSCCGVEFGNEDYEIESIKKYREKWINEGAKWFNTSKKPNNWDLMEQLKNILEEFI